MVASFVFCGEAFAQPVPGSYRDSLGVPFNNPISASISTMIWGKINRAALQQSQRTRGNRASNSGRGSAASSRRNSSTPVNTAPTPSSGPVIPENEIVPTYRSYPAVHFKPTGTRLTLDEYLRNVKVGEIEKTELKYLIPAIWQVYEEEAVLKGYPNDVALALVSCIGINAHIYAGRTSKLSVSFEQNVGVRDMLAEQVTEAGTFNNFSDRQKQELYELFILLGGLTLHYYLKAVKENNVKDLAELKLVAASNLKLLGIEP